MAKSSCVRPRAANSRERRCRRIGRRRVAPERHRGGVGRALTVDGAWAGTTATLFRRPVARVRRDVHRGAVPARGIRRDVRRRRRGRSSARRRAAACLRARRRAAPASTRRFRARCSGRRIASASTGRRPAMTLSRRRDGGRVRAIADQRRAAAARQRLHAGRRRADRGLDPHGSIRVSRHVPVARD